MNFEFGEVFTRAWQITWKNKVLWGISVLPFLVVFLILPIWFFGAFGAGLDPARIDRLMADQTFVIISILIYFVIILGSIFLQIVSRSSATLGVYRAETGLQPITFVDLLQDGSQFFWRIFGVTFLIGVAIIVLFIAFFACTGILSAVTMGLATLCLQPLFLLMIPITLVVMAVVEQAESAVVADGLGVIDSITRGYELVKANFGKYLLITLVIYIGMNILITLVGLPFMLPMFFFMMRNLDAGMEFNNMFRMQAIFGAILFPIMALIQGFSLTYLKSAMMITYLRLTRSTSAPQPSLQEVTA